MSPKSASIQISTIRIVPEAKESLVRSGCPSLSVQTELPSQRLFALSVGWTATSTMRLRASLPIRDIGPVVSTVIQCAFESPYRSVSVLRIGRRPPNRRLELAAPLVVELHL